MNALIKNTELPKRFIIVDDDSTNNIICKLSLSRLCPSIEIKTFLNPEKALHYIKTYYETKEDTTPTVLFLDINMPIISGWKFLEIFNNFSDAIKAQFKFYMLTASIDHLDQEKAASNLRIEKYLSKPLSTKLIQSIF